MTILTLHGIPNCDTVKKARAWLRGRAVDFAFRDFKKAPPSHAEIERWADVVGWETLLNTRGTTFRALAGAEKTDLDRDKAIALMVAKPSLIKRPVIEHGGMISVGWNAEIEQALRG